MDDFTRNVRGLVRRGALTYREALLVIEREYSLSEIEAKDILDGYIVASARNLMQVTSMAEVTNLVHIPQELADMFVGFDCWLADKRKPFEKLVCQLAIEQGIFYYCFGKSRGVEKSRSESKAVDKWIFRSLLLHSDRKWYYKGGYNEADTSDNNSIIANKSVLEGVIAQIEGIGGDVPLNIVVHTLDLSELVVGVGALNALTYC